MDLQVLIFLALIWLITWIIKNLPPQKQESDEVIFPKKISEKIKYYSGNNQENEKKEKTTPQPQHQKKVISPSIVKTKSGINLKDLLKSKSSLRTAFLLKEILDKPVGEQDFI